MLFPGCGDASRAGKGQRTLSCQLWCPSGWGGEGFPFPPAYLVARWCTVGPHLQIVTPMFLCHIQGHFLVVTSTHSADLEYPSSDTISAGSELLNDQGGALWVQRVLGKNCRPVTPPPALCSQGLILLPPGFRSRQMSPFA